MADRLESLVLDILLRDRASEGLSKIGRASGDASKDVNTLTGRLNDLSRKSATARVELAGNKEAQAALDKLDAKLIALDHRVATSDLKVTGTTRAIAELSAVELELDKIGKKGGSAELATSSLGTAGLSGPGGMGALIGAGVALSPVIATLGAGFGGLGLAALALSKNTKLMKTELAPLKAEFNGFAKSLQPEVLGLFNQGIGIAGHLLHDLQPVAAATGKAFSGFLSQLDKEFQSQKWQGFFQFMATTAATDVQLVGNAFIAWSNALPPLLENLQGVATATATVVTKAGQLTGVLATAANKADAFGSSGQKAHGFWQTLTKDVTGWLELRNLWDPAAKGADKAAVSVGHVGVQAHTAAEHVQLLAQQVNALTTAESKSLSPLLAYSNALIAQQNDAAALNKALQTSHDKIGLATTAQRNSFSAANTYIQDLLNTAAAAARSHRGLDDVITSLRNELPHLQSARGGTRAYWQEVSTLVGWLHRLELLKPINETVRIFGSGQWRSAGIQGIPAGVRAPGLAGGGRIPGFGGGDRWPALLEGGEAVVDKQTTAVHAAELRAWGVPGMAAGGIIPSYSGRPGGLVPWGQHNWAATIAGITAAIANAMAAQFKKAAAAAAGGIGNYHPGAGVQQWRGVVSQALGLAGSSQQLVDAVLYQMQSESGGNPRAVNLWDSNAKAGHPSVGLMQVIRGTFQAYAGRFRNTGPFAYGVSENPLANVYSAIKYAQANYGPGLRNAQGGIGTGHGYDQGGWLPTGLSLAYNGTGKPERVGGPAVVTYNINIVLPPGSDREQGRRIVNYIRAFEKGSGAGWRK